MIFPDSNFNRASPEYAASTLGIELQRIGKIMEGGVRFASDHQQPTALPKQISIFRIQTNGLIECAHRADQVIVVKLRFAVFQRLLKQIWFGWNSDGHGNGAVVGFWLKAFSFPGGPLRIRPGKEPVVSPTVVSGRRISLTLARTQAARRRVQHFFNAVMPYGRLATFSFGSRPASFGSGVLCLVSACWLLR